MLRYVLQVYDLKEPPSSLFGTLLFTLLNTQQHHTDNNISFLLGGSSGNFLKNKVILITGGTSGMGKELSKRFSELGAVVYATSLPCDSGKVYESNCVHDIPLDLAEFKSIFSLVERLKHENIKIDIFVSNAGVARSRDFVTTEGFEECFAINYLGAFLITNLLIKNNLFNSGIILPKIIFIASDSHHQVPPVDIPSLGIPRPYNVFSTIKIYSQTKFLLVSFFTELAHRTRGKFQVFAICPGPFFSDIGTNKSPKVIAQLIKCFRWLSNPPVSRAAVPVIELANIREGLESGSYFLKGVKKSPAKGALDHNFRRDLWKKTVQIINNNNIKNNTNTTTSTDTTHSMSINSTTINRKGSITNHEWEMEEN